MAKDSGYKSGLTSKKPLGQKAPRGEAQGQRPVKDAEPRAKRK